MSLVPGRAIAEALHTLAGRTGRFGRLPVSAIAGSLIESELFGHKKGSFTGATDRPGWLEKCSANGTLVLDDLNQIDLMHLPKLLQALEERKIARVGDDAPINVSGTMVVVTSNEDLATKKGFPLDVLERLSRHVIRVPDISSRLPDIPNLTRHFLLQQQPAAAAIREYRFQIAAKIRAWGHVDEGVSVRSIRNEIETLVRESQDVSAVIENRDSRQMQLLAVIQKLCPGGETPIKAQVATELGIGKSTLSDPNTRYGKAWLDLAARGKIPL